MTSDSGSKPENQEIPAPSALVIEGSVPVNTAGTGEALRRISGFAANLSLGERIQARLMVVVDEILSNILRHGGRRTKAQFIITLRKTVTASV